MQIKRLIVGKLETNCYLVISKNEPRSRETSLRGEVGVIDPGGEAEKILKEIRDIKAVLKYIINTHCHFDHTSANEKIRKETGAKILIHRAEKNFINLAPYRAGGSGAGFEPDRFLEEGDEIRIGDIILKVLHTPGHTRGSICLIGENLVFTGDILFRDGYGRTDLPEGSQKDLEKSLEKLSKLLKPGIIVYPGHGEIFSFIL